MIGCGGRDDSAITVGPTKEGRAVGSSNQIYTVSTANLNSATGSNCRTCGSNTTECAVIIEGNVRALLSSNQAEATEPSSLPFPVLVISTSISSFLSLKLALAHLSSSPSLALHTERPLRRRSTLKESTRSSPAAQVSTVTLRSRSLPARKRVLPLPSPYSAAQFPRTFSRQ